MTLSILIEIAQLFGLYACLLVIVWMLAFYIYLVCIRYTRSTLNHVGILHYTHRRLGRLAYDATDRLWLFIPLCTLYTLYESLTGLHNTTTPWWVDSQEY